VERGPVDNRLGGGEFVDDPAESSGAAMPPDSGPGPPVVGQCSAATAPRVKTAADSSEAGVEDLALRSRVRSSSRPPAAHAGDPTHDEHRTGHNPRPEDPGIPVDPQSSGGRVQCTLTDHGNGYDPPSPATSRPRTRARPAPDWLAADTAELQDPRPDYLP
jgi:hypothetical protein